MNASGLKSRPSTPFDALQGEDRQERHRDHQQREEDTGTHLLHGLDEQRSTALGTALAVPALEFLVDILDEDDRSVDHRSDRHRDAPQRHDVDRQSLVEHRHERQQYRQGQGDGGHQSAPCME